MLNACKEWRTGRGAGARPTRSAAWAVDRGCRARGSLQHVPQRRSQEAKRQRTAAGTRPITRVVLHATGPGKTREQPVIRATPCIPTGRERTQGRGTVAMPKEAVKVATDASRSPRRSCAAAPRWGISLGSRDGSRDGVSRWGLVGARPAGQSPAVGGVGPSFARGTSGRPSSRLTRLMSSHVSRLWLGSRSR
jgi:hypothetical protein